MPKCPNCGQSTARTEDWACQWCGFPLTSTSFKNIGKTYQQLQEEKQVATVPATEAEAELEPIPEPEPEQILEPEVISEHIHEPEMAVAAEPMQEMEPETVPVTESEPEPEAEPEIATEPEVVTEPESAAVPPDEPTIEPAVKPEPVFDVIELTFEELLGAYETEGVNADTRFSNKILQITGAVSRIEIKEELNIHYISLGSPQQNTLVHLRCVFDEAYGDELSKLTFGQMVTVRGKYDGSIIDMRMSDCIIVT